MFKWLLNRTEKKERKKKVEEERRRKEKKKTHKRQNGKHCEEGYKNSATDSCYKSFWLSGLSSCSCRYRARSSSYLFIFLEFCIGCTCFQVIFELGLVGIFVVFRAYLLFVTTEAVVISATSFVRLPIEFTSRKITSQLGNMHIETAPDSFLPMRGKIFYLVAR